MKIRTQKHVSLGLLALSLAAVLVLSACSAAPTAAPANAKAPSSPKQLPSGQALAKPVTPVTCLAGSWNLADFSAYMNSIEQKASSGTDITVTSQKFTGAASFKFNDDNTAVFTANKFSQSFTVTTTAAGQTLDIPVTLDIDGTSSSKYTVQDDRVSFSDQDNSALTISVETMGNSSAIDEGLFGTIGTVQVDQFACPDANTLTLKILSAGADLAPLTLTRAK